MESRWRVLWVIPCRISHISRTLRTKNQRSHIWIITHNTRLATATAPLFSLVDDVILQSPLIFFVEIGRGPLYQNPPTKLNFFELLRTSLGDSQFNDVWLVPEAPHFHQKALGLDKMIDFEPPKVPIFWEGTGKIGKVGLGWLAWLLVVGLVGLGKIDGMHVDWSFI